MSQQITFIHFKRLICSQPYLVWNPLPKAQTWSDEELHFDEDSFLEHDLTFGEAVLARSHQILMGKFLAHLIQHYPGFQVVSAGEWQKKVAQTEKYYQDPDVAFIYNPVWSFDYRNYQVLANPIFYDKKTATVAFIKLSTSTKRSDLYKIYFDVQVMLKLAIPVKEIVLYIVASKNYRRGEVSFFKTTTINFNKGPSKTTLVSETDFAQLQQAKVTRVKGPNLTLYEFLIENKALEFEFASFNFYLEKIVESAATKSLLPFRPCYFGAQLCYCLHWKEVVELTANSAFHNWNNRVVVKKYFHEQLSLGDIARQSLVVSEILGASGPMFYENALSTLMVERIKSVKTGRAVWYDFEAYTLPVAPLDHYLPFTQVVYQVSVIKTEQEREIERQNYVFDPRYLTVDDFVKIIRAIYDPAADAYVVYNASYEHSRLNEMLFRLKIKKHGEYHLVSQMVSQIKERCLDLAKLFQVNSPRILPPILIPELRGKSSIKLLEQYIHAHHSDLPYQIADYQSLNIKNGMQAMDVACQRALGIIGDREWQEKVEDLKQYCQNDVQAMVLVYYLIKKLFPQRILGSSIHEYQEI